MKLSNLLRHTLCLCSFIFAFFIASCSTTPSPAATEKAPLSSSEKSVYDDALNNIKAGDADKAISALKKLTQSHPAFLGGWVNLATAYYNSKKPEDAGYALANAKKINPNIPEIYNLTGLLDVEKGEYKSAEKNYLSAIALKNDYATAHYNLAIVYDVFYQDIEKAVVEYEKYLTLTGNSDKSTSNWVAELKSKLKRKTS